MEQRVSQSETGLSVDDFKRMVATMGAKELALIPIEKLPEIIPEEVLDIAPMESKSVIEDFIFELNTREIHLQMELAEYFSAEVIDALNLSKNMSLFPSHGLFKARVSELLLLYKRWEKNRSDKDREWLIPKIKEIDGIVPDFRMETKVVIRSYLLLEDALSKAGKYQNKFETAIVALRQKEKSIEASLGRYFILRLAVIGNEMLNQEVKIRNAEACSQDIQKRIDFNHEELTKLKSRTFFSRRVKRDKMDGLKDDTSRLMIEKQAVEVMINENDLTGWLDVIVDASICRRPTANNDAALRKVRKSLYRLLSKYCQGQEDGALQIAKNPFLQVDPKQSIKFMLLSEQFILDYFANKKSQMIAWLGDAAETKICQLRSVEKDLLKELKRNARFKK